MFNLVFVLSLRLFPVFFQSANDMKIFIVLSESPLNARKIALYRFLISFLVPELLSFKDLINDRKMVRKMRGQNQSKLIKSVSDVMDI